MSAPLSSKDDLCSELRHWHDPAVGARLSNRAADEIERLSSELRLAQGARDYANAMLDRYRATPETEEKPVAWRHLVDSPYTKHPEWHYTEQQPTMEPQRFEALFTQPAETSSPQAPIARIHVHNDKITGAKFYTPGLPDGEHDLYCEPPAHGGQKVPFFESDCQHDLLKPGTTIEVIDKWKAKCKVCIEFFDLPGRPERLHLFPYQQNPQGTGQLDMPTEKTNEGNA